MTETHLQKSGALGKLQEFCSETTAHGFGRLASASSAIERLLWLVCLLAALTYTIVQGFDLVSEYFSYPVDVKVEMKHREDLEFPAIVICNMNAMRKQALNEVVEEGQVTVSICLITTLTVISWLNFHFSVFPLIRAPYQIIANVALFFGYAARYLFCQCG